ncbi:multicopper oxidase domain-containing protein [Brevibacterium yomogidense]|uniref:Uncharacterized protein n=1 Tax=Brevibacterium yomogidense TaxID=946573 RepID=A0A1X6WXN1_9MICO|nr:multicopper oxidase domain-containing protein [Brevibacterium yomogidense]SLM90434.1 hypothetical protein FM105_01995 [Brevibacterium yomogidense]
MRTAPRWTSDVLPHNFHVHDVQFQVLDVDGQGSERTHRTAGRRRTRITEDSAASSAG